MPLLVRMFATRLSIICPPLFFRALESRPTSIQPLKETHFSLSDYVDFPKVIANVEDISINLNLLNYLIGQSDMASAVRRLWDVNPKAFSVLDILIAVRTKDNKKAIDKNGTIHPISDYFNSPEPFGKST